VANLRGRGEIYLDFYCSPSGAEGTIYWIDAGEHDG